MASIAQQSHEESMSEARAFWNRLMEKHPNIRGVLSIIGSLLGFFINGHVVVALGHWVVMVSGRIAEKAMLFAVIWLTVDYIAYDFLSQHIATTASTLSTISLLALTLLPEIILYSAVVTSLKYWFSFFRDRQRVWALAWAVLYTIPTFLFCTMTILMLCSLASSGGHWAQASDQTMVIRSLAGWFYSLVTLIHMAVGDRFGAAPETVVQPTPVAPAPAPIDYQEVAQQLVPLLTPHLNGLKTTIIEEIKPLIPAPAPTSEPVNYEQLLERLAQKVASEPVDYQTLAQQVAPLLAAPESMAPAPIDYQEVARVMLPLLKPSFVEARRTIIEEVKAIVPQIVMPGAAPVPQIEAPASTKAQAEQKTTTQTEGTDVETEETERDVRLEAAFATLVSEGKKISGRALADEAHCNRTAATNWLKLTHPEYMNAKATTSEPVLAPESAVEATEPASMSEGGAGATEPQQVVASKSGAITSEPVLASEPEIESTAMEPVREPGATEPVPGEIESTEPEPVNGESTEQVITEEVPVAPEPVRA